MREKKLNVHYSYMVPALFLQIATTILMITVMSVEDYGMYTLYLTTINFLYFATLGIPDGYIVKNRSKAKKQIPSVSKLVIQYLILQITIVTLGSVAIFATGFSNLYIYPIIGAGAMNMYQLTQAIFRNLNEAHKQNIYLLTSRVIYIVDGICYVFTKSIEMAFIVDIILRTILFMIAFLQINYEYAGNANSEKSNLNQYSKAGFMIMFSNTIFSLSLMVDKYALASDLEHLGLYSVAITVVLMFRVLLMPLNQVLFVTIDENMDVELLAPKLLKLIYISFVLLIPALIVGTTIIERVNILNKYVEAIPIIAVTLLIVPLMVPVESIFVNLGKLQNSNLFLTKSLIVALFYIIVLFGYVKISDFNIVFYSLLAVACYFFAFVIYSYNLLNKKLRVKFYGSYLILSIVYLLMYYVYL